ncbi:DUF669 domain-containing protein [Cloacibacillus evryensis]|uniref:DUF669 domain-containing protein n=1 Tax=Cloacibacillus evryensis TaxID=508460 RepID=UPI002B20E970|nr:DUF669 domain-containing protein [Cloacibacillus evryensis]MEA5034207.1 DUF669 domain-containing protein [Cloacibacillus evryensis]
MPNWNYDAKDYDPNGHFQPIPPGDYRVRIEEAEDTQSKAGNDMTKLTLSVSGKKCKLWFYLVFPDASDQNYSQRKQMINQKLGELWESFNMTVGDMNILNWRGKVGAARVKQEMNQQKGEMQNAISYFLTRSRQKDLPAWQEPDGEGSGASAQPATPIGDSMSLRADENGNVDLPF